MMYKIINGLIDCTPNPGSLQFSKSNRVTNGQANKLQIPQYRTDVHLHSFFPSAARLWNRLPQEVTNATSLTSRVRS